MSVLRPGIGRRRFMGAGLSVIGGAALLPLLDACSGPLGANPSPGPVAPKRGGALRAAWTGAGQSESLSPWTYITNGDLVRTALIFDTLTDFGPNGTDVAYLLAESMTPNSDSTMWRMKLRDGVQWHDGKPLTGDDVVFSLTQVLDPNIGAQWMPYLAAVDMSRTRVVGPGLLDIACKMPALDLPVRFAGMPVAQKGASDFSRTAVGTGAFKLVSFTPGEGSVFARNDKWWAMPGGPYLDQVQLRSIPDNTARLNALKSGDLDLVSELSYAQFAELRSSGSVRLTRIPSANIPCFKLNVSKPPFNDMRVLQAFKLMVDRQQMLDNVFLGFGQVGNDTFGQGLADYDTGLKTPPHDLARARQLLAQAGQSNLSITLHTTDGYPGTFESATLFAEQAKQAGVRVTIDKVAVGDYFNPIDRYLGWEIASSIYSLNWPITSLIPELFTKDANFNESDFNHPDFDATYQQAVSITDKGLRKKLLDQLQQRLQAEDGHMIFGLGDAVLASSPRVHGLTALPFYRPGGEGDFSKVFLA